MREPYPGYAAARAHWDAIVKSIRLESFRKAMERCKARELARSSM